jgi:lysophospholipase L1-like esterase
MKLLSKCFILLAFFAIAENAISQPFINEIKAFRRADSTSMPPQNAILLIGSSSFTNWKDVAKYFPEHTIINRGFGGSSLPHMTMYAEDIIFKYNPKQIIIYCGENDLTGGPSITADTIFNRVKKLHQLIRSRYKKVPIAYISMKPSPSREKYLETMQKGNAMIKSFMEHEKRSSYIDVYSSMLDANGKILTHIFLSDKLHMNAEGYKIWQGVIAPYLVKQKFVMWR